MLRKVQSIPLVGTVPGIAPGKQPQFEWVDPSSLLIDGAYQRDLSRRSIVLIERIVANWDWSKFKPPVVARTEHGLEIIDGQHTAISAATHQDIGMIPVMVVDAPSQEDRARAFVGHNRDRITLSQIQIHYANVAAGDEDAVTIQQTCDRAGVKLLRYPPGNGEFKPGESLAIGALRSLISRRFALGARKVLSVISQARCAPVRSDHMKAVEELMYSPEYAGTIAPETITSILISLGNRAESLAKAYALQHGMPQWRALTIIIFKEAQRGSGISSEGRSR
jgi:hypothetical protein